MFARLDRTERVSAGSATVATSTDHAWERSRRREPNRRIGRLALTPKAQQQERALAKLNPREMLMMGSAGLKATLVAAAEVEAYVAPGYAGQRWDACAADALSITAAGGKLTNTYRRTNRLPRRGPRSPTIMASSPATGACTK